jgi:hypothetical protein
MLVAGLIANQMVKPSGTIGSDRRGVAALQARSVSATELPRSFDIGRGADATAIRLGPRSASRCYWASDRAARHAGAVPLRASLASLFDIEPHALREWKLRPEIDRVGGATHRPSTRRSRPRDRPRLLLAAKAPPIWHPKVRCSRSRCRSPSPMRRQISASRTSSEDGR